MKQAALTLVLLLMSLAGLHAQTLRPDRVYPEFAIGPSGVSVSIEKDLAVTVTKSAIPISSPGTF